MYHYYGNNYMYFHMFLSLLLFHFHLFLQLVENKMFYLYIFLKQVLELMEEYNHNM